MSGTVENRRVERRANIVQQGTVLVIDDEADIRELLELSLLRMGLAVECIGSVEAAKQLLQSKRYDLCLTDMRLPDGDGLELVRFIGVQCADLPVAVITRSAAPKCRGGPQGRRLRLLTKPCPSISCAPWSSPRCPCPRRQPQPNRGSPASWLEPRGRAGALEDREARAQPGADLHYRRVRERKGARRASHSRQGSRREKAFVPVNCGAIPRT